MPGKGGASANSKMSAHQQHMNHHHSHSHHHKKRASVQESLNAASLYTVYNMLNRMKTDLLWGRNQEDITEEAAPVTTTTTTATVKAPEAITTTTQTKATAEEAKQQQQEVKGHIRRPSTVSMASSNSSSGSTISDDSESEISNENDSGIESENNQHADKSEELAKQFRVHLNGLYRTLEQMTEAANYLTARYQSDMGQV